MAALAALAAMAPAKGEAHFRRRCRCPVPCATLCEPQYVERTVMVPQWTTDTRTVNVTEYRNETRERTITVHKPVPETQQKTRTYTVMVPRTETETVNYTVTKPVYETKTVEYEVNVPVWNEVG